MSTQSSFFHHLRRSGVSVVIDLSAQRLPVLLYWGADLGEMSQQELADFACSQIAPLGPNDLDIPEIVEVLPLASGGWRGQPGIEGHGESGSSWSPRFSLEDVRREDDAAGESLSTVSLDQETGIEVRIDIELKASGLMRQRATLTRRGASPYTLDSLQLTFPIADTADELLDLAGRWGRERSPQRMDFSFGTHLRDSRRGRTGHDAALVVAAGTRGFGFRHGEVWTVHTAWSGNHRTYAERVAGGQRVLAGGELLTSGEVILRDGESYTSPWIYGSYGQGLDRAANRFHEYLRARPHHPRGTRPFTLNVWEAVYFDHDLQRLSRLAELAADLGVERFVLDDGWFRHRRDDTAGLGDWYVDEEVWPDGLTPLVEKVASLGMQFGLWVEPEMVNVDSDLARAHPEWILAPGPDRLPIPFRHQQALNLGNPDAYDYILSRLSALVSEYSIGYFKWDHNRDIIEAGSLPGGNPGIHAQTLAVYRLIDELKGRFPGLEIESCASGGGRADLGILERTDRIWGSDVIDPLERQQIQEWTYQLLPPELIGSHIGAPTAHTTGRTQRLSFRAGTALIAHMGIEWDISSIRPEEREQLREWVRLYKRMRPLLHSGRLVRADLADPTARLHGVVSQDRSEAIFAYSQLQTPETALPGRLCFPGLDPDAVYRVTSLPPGDAPARTPKAALVWLAQGPTQYSGRLLATAGLRGPLIFPEDLILFHMRKV